MKATYVQAGLLLAGVEAAVVDRRDVPGTVHWPLQRRNDVPLLRRRSGTDTGTLANNDTLGAYLTTVQVGTPGQTLTLQVDTGSSDTWVPAVSAPVCKAGNCTYGDFDKSKSSSFKEYLPGKFNISYGDGSHSIGDYFTDTFSLGSASLTELVMGLGIDTDIPYGLVGVGFETGEAVISATNDQTYVNLPYQMANMSVIATPAYSLWLNDLDASTGNILFGGVDTNKFQGSLTRVSLVPDPESGIIDRFLINLTSITATSSSGSDKIGSAYYPLPVLLDSGSTISMLPVDIVAQIYNEVGITSDMVDPESLIAYPPCRLSGSSGEFDFGFGGPKGAVIRVGMQELLRPVGTDDLGNEVCQFGIYPMGAGADLAILGDTFLRSAYVTYDLANFELGLAQTIFNTTQTNIVAFPSPNATIPSSTPAPSQGWPVVASGIVTQSVTAYAAQAGFNVTTSGKKSAAMLVATPPTWVSAVMLSAFVAGALAL